MALTNKLSAIGDAIREKTGKADKLTLDQMPLEIASIVSGGGSSGGASGIYMAKITPAEEVGSITVTHNLGTTDILLAACFAESLGDVVPDNGRGLCAMWAKTAIPNNRGGVGYSFLAGYNTSNSAVTCTGPNSSAYWCEVVDSNKFVFRRPGSASAMYEGGVTYTVIIMAASAFKETEG